MLPKSTGAVGAAGDVIYSVSTENRSKWVMVFIQDPNVFFMFHLIK